MSVCNLVAVKCPLVINSKHRDSRSLIFFNLHVLPGPARARAGAGAWVGHRAPLHQLFFTHPPVPPSNLPTTGSFVFTGLWICSPMLPHTQSNLTMKRNIACLPITFFLVSNIDVWFTTICEIGLERHLCFNLPTLVKSDISRMFFHSLKSKTCAC